MLCTGNDPFSLSLAVDFVAYIAKGLADQGRDISGTPLARAALAAQLMRSDAEMLDKSGLPRSEVVQRWNAKLTEVSRMISQLAPATTPSPPPKRSYTIKPIEGCTVSWQREIEGVKTCWEVSVPGGKRYVAITYPNSDAIDIESIDGKRVAGQRLVATMAALKAAGHFQRHTG